MLDILEEKIEEEKIIGLVENPEFNKASFGKVIFTNSYVSNALDF